MRIASTHPRAPRPVFSFEFFPPEDRRGRSEPARARSQILKDDGPDFVSVTYGAGGTTRERTVEIIKCDQAGPRHRGDGALLAASASRASGCDEILDEIAAAGIENVLALRGDPPRGRDRVDSRTRAASATRSS